MIHCRSWLHRSLRRSLCSTPVPSTFILDTSSLSIVTMKRYLSISTFLSATFGITNLQESTAWNVPSLHQHVGCTVALSRSFPSLSRGTVRFMSSSDAEDTPINFKRADSIQIEIISFGPLGASVQVVGIGHSPDDLIPEEDPPLGRGLVLQKEIHYFRQARDNVDVVKGEVLPAYVEKVRDDGKLDISLRLPGGKAKADELSKVILDRLEWSPDGSLQVGDKSSPKDIGYEFPGVSKAAFKKAVSALYKKGLVQPGPNSISLMKQSQE